MTCPGGGLEVQGFLQPRPMLDSVLETCPVCARPFLSRREYVGLKARPSCLLTLLFQNLSTGLLIIKSSTLSPRNQIAKNKATCRFDSLRNLRSGTWRFSLGSRRYTHVFLGHIYQEIMTAMLKCEPFRVKNNLSLCDINGRGQERTMWQRRNLGALAGICEFHLSYL